MKFHSTKILILMIVCNLAALTGYYFLFQYIIAQSNAATSLISTINFSQQKDSHLSSLRSVVKDTEVSRQQLTAFLLSSDNEVPFIGQIETLAKNSGLTVKTNSVSSVAVDTGATKTFQMQAETTGSWSSILYFLSQVENLPYNIRVQNVSLNKQAVSGKTTNSGLSWTAVIDLSVTESK